MFINARDVNNLDAYRRTLHKGIAIKNIRMLMAVCYLQNNPIYARYDYSIKQAVPYPEKSN